MAAPCKCQHTQTGRARDGQRPPYSTLSPLIHSPDPVFVYCSSVAHLRDSSIFTAHSDHLLHHRRLSVNQTASFSPVFHIWFPYLCCLISRRLSEFPFWGYPCFICPGLQLMTSSPFSSCHGLVHSSQQPLQSILLSGPFCHRRKPVPFWLFAICILPVSQHRKPPWGFGWFCSCPSVLHGSEAVCECIPCPAHPEAPLPCCPMYVAPGRLLYFPWDPVNHSPKAVF